MSGSGQPPLDRWERAAAQDRQRARDDAHAFLHRRPFGQYLVVQVAWGCLGAVVGLLLSGWELATVNFLLLAGGGLLVREYVRRRYARDRDLDRDRDIEPEG
ncbi:hypothetical protein [Modestobacter sp. SYSU DS0657]